MATRSSTAGDTNCAGGTCSHTGTLTGPDGKTATTSGDVTKTAPGQYSSSGSVTGSNGNTVNHSASTNCAGASCSPFGHGDRFGWRNRQSLRHGDACRTGRRDDIDERDGHAWQHRDDERHGGDHRRRHDGQHDGRRCAEAGRCRRRRPSYVPPPVVYVPPPRLSTHRRPRRRPCMSRRASSMWRRRRAPPCGCRVTGSGTCGCRRTGHEQKRASEPSVTRVRGCGIVRVTGWLSAHASIDAHGKVVQGWCCHPAVRCDGFGARNRRGHD